MLDYFILSDVHGCFKTLEQLLKVMDVKSKDFIINLGDVVDRGPRIKECLDFFIERPNTINILGNHDYCFSDYVLGNTHKNYFMYNQGLKETLEQTGNDAKKYAEIIKDWLPLYRIPWENYIFCHASYPWIEGDTFNPEYHLWERWYYTDKKFYNKYYDGPTIVHGHTPTFGKNAIIEEKANDGKLLGINLDMGSCYKKEGCGLRGMRLSDKKIFEVDYCD